MGIISELSSAISFLILKNAIALLSSEMTTIPSKSTFGPSRVACRSCAVRTVELVVGVNFQ